MPEQSRLNNIRQTIRDKMPGRPHVDKPGAARVDMPGAAHVDKPGAARVDKPGAAHVDKRSIARWCVRALRGNLPAVILCAILFVLLIFLFNNAAAAGRLFPDYSLRYDGGISGDKAYSARLYAINSGADEGAVFWPTFWREDSSQAKSDTGSSSCTSITFSGDGALVWNADFLRGSMPGVTDASGCALSTELAETLFGSTDIVGMDVDIDDVTMTVRGVFQGTQELALVSVGDEDTSHTWQVVELGGNPENANSSSAESFGTTSGLGRPTTVFAGASITLWARIAAFLPVIILIVYVIVRLLMLIPRGIRGVVIFAVCLAVALLLPSILQMLPGWAVPDMWSDFSYWSSLKGQFDAALRDLLGNAPYLRDVEGKLALLGQGALCFAATICAVVICVVGFRYNVRPGEAKQSSIHSTANPSADPAANPVCPTGSHVGF